jgi:hypothetical protein
MTDEEVLIVARHAESLVHILIAVALQDVRVLPSCRDETRHLAAIQ